MAVLRSQSRHAARLAHRFMAALIIEGNAPARLAVGNAPCGVRADTASLHTRNAEINERVGCGKRHYETLSGTLDLFGGQRGRHDAARRRTERLFRICKISICAQ